jgi:uncharacterized protein (DUF2267 family)
MPAAWQLFIYRLPSKPSRARVAVWRELRRLGALPLQSGVVAAPELGELPARLDAAAQRVADEGGVTYRFRLTRLDTGERDRLEAEWSALRAQEYAEIVEECETKFVREVEFEIFRDNLTAGEAEEIEADLEKLKGWLGRVVERDSFGAPNRGQAEAAIARCAAMLEDFMERVYEAESHHGPSLEPPADLPWGTTGDGVVELRDARRRQRRSGRDR